MFNYVGVYSCGCLFCESKIANVDIPLAPFKGG